MTIVVAISKRMSNDVTAGKLVIEGSSNEIKDQKEEGVAVDGSTGRPVMPKLTRSAMIHSHCRVFVANDGSDGTGDTLRSSRCSCCRSVSL